MTLDSDRIRQLVEDAVRVQCRDIITDAANEVFTSRHAELENLIRADERDRIIRTVRVRLGYESAVLLTKALEEAQ